MEMHKALLLLLKEHISLERLLNKKTVPLGMEPFARLFFLQGCRNRLTFAASIIETTSGLMLRSVNGGNLKLNDYD